MAKPLRPPARQLYEQGVRVIVAETRRNLPSALSPHIKATNFLNNILAKREAIAKEAFDSILLNWQEQVAECTVSNLFWVKDGRIFTPSLACGILDGITRDVVITVAHKAGLPLQEGQYGIDVLRQADECFLTNTSMELMPVTIIDDRIVGSGKPGPMTRQLHEHFVVYRRQFLESYPS
jgi:branched-chain amino acid aminotransferase